MTGRQLAQAADPPSAAPLGKTGSGEHKNRSDSKGDSAGCFSTASRLLVFSGTQDCFWLTVPDESKQGIWVGNAVLVGEPCW